jgi:hypothetical protein
MQEHGPESYMCDSPKELGYATVRSDKKLVKSRFPHFLMRKRPSMKRDSTNPDWGLPGAHQRFEIP